MQHQYRNIILTNMVTVALLALVVAGCSFSDSSKSISNIVSSPIKSSSDSSKSEQSYESDVADYTTTYIKSGGDTTKLKSGISQVAEKRGITDWEKDSATYQGLGQGFKRAGVTQVEVDAYKHTLADTDEQASWIQQGYDAANKDN
jgi:hypothetical protein